MNRIKTAVVIGGTSGIGRSIARALAANGTQVTVFGRSLPENAEENIQYQRLNLLSGDYEPLKDHLACDALIYAAGLGRIEQIGRIAAAGKGQRDAGIFDEELPECGWNEVGICFHGNSSMGISRAR